MSLSHPRCSFGWDCHGLPVEYEIDQALGITSPQQVMEMGIAAYNGHCRSIVSRYCNEWERVVSRLGRWIDFRNDYKVMRVGGVRRYAAPHTAPHNCGLCACLCAPDDGAVVHGVRVVGLQDSLREGARVPWLQGEGVRSPCVLWLWWCGVTRGAPWCRSCRTPTP